jgi:hypothetical protein
MIFASMMKKVKVTSLGEAKAHGGRSGTNSWWWLNFPTAAEVQYAVEQGMGEMATEAESTERVAKAATQGFKSSFTGVCWDKRPGASNSELGEPRKCLPPRGVR